ncbi:carboxypeptidase-like regulatory domain-containing protein [Aequorivita antarctica]|uniref:Carboxypeptidase-like regulatory domain-containing protein n=2 Tax=Aequorivita antarctica TaxID=153266 RepID=A0A5C6Z1I0_9FLAO|nr:carboxypeptidase-like regulatory domain-containing protein [Aequorivita antarctica]TXD73336.1 carboxypeptidase-like regulatory domain-containing protein [Aequorivita antarctica]
MKKICILLLLISNLIWSQNNKIQGVVKDSETFQPIPYVNIYSENELKNNSTGSISNENGEFTVINNKSKIVFSHINYETFSIESDGNLKEILLKPKNYVLDEIVISNEKPKDYLKKIIKLSKNKIDKNTLLKGYCREIVKVNNEYTKYSDALVDYYIKKGNGKANLVLGQHRALKSNNLINEDDKSIGNDNSPINVKDYVKNAYSFETIEKLLKSDDYEFERKIMKEANGDEYEYIGIIPNEESDEMLNKGYVIIDPKSKSILEFKIYTSENHLKNAKTINLLIAKAKRNNILVWSKFKIINNQYILIYSKKQVGMYIKMGKKVDHNFDYASDLFVYEFKNNVEIPDNGYSKKTLFEAGNSFTDNFWTKYNIFPLSENEEKFINSIQQK